MEKDAASFVWNHFLSLQPVWESYLPIGEYISVSNIRHMMTDGKTWKRLIYARCSRLPQKLP
jgi:hypothetical protein